MRREMAGGHHTAPVCSFRVNFFPLHLHLTIDLTVCAVLTPGSWYFSRLA